MGHAIVYCKDIELGVVSDNKIMLDATPPGGGSRGSANYKSHRTLDLAVKLQQLPALQSVNITPASGYNVDRFVHSMGGGGNVDLYVHGIFCCCFSDHG